MLDDISVILVGSVICNLNALISVNDNNSFPLAVEGSALKSPCKDNVFNFPQVCQIDHILKIFNAAWTYDLYPILLSHLIENPEGV